MYWCCIAFATAGAQIWILHHTSHCASVHAMWVQSPGRCSATGWQLPMPHFPSIMAPTLPGIVLNLAHFLVYVAAAVARCQAKASLAHMTKSALLLCRWMLWHCQWYLADSAASASHSINQLVCNTAC
jgi:hypothetical protein